MTLLIQYTIIFASVLLLVALGGCFSERSGVINIGLEGIMVIGALGGALVMKFLPVSVGAPVMVLTVILASAAAGLLYSLLLAVASITFRADQTITGTAMNLLATAAATVAVKAMNASMSGGNDVSSDISYIEPKKLFILNIGLRACGEHPQAADSVGINVYKMRYAGVMISGVLGGLGGIAFITAGVSVWKFEYGVAGFGFLALAVMIFGGWSPVKIALAAILFGFFRALGNVYSGFDFLLKLNMPSVVYNMLPYFVSLIVLAFTSKKSRAPKAEGIPYDKGQR